MELVLVPNSPGRAIAIMREVAAWGRERGLRVWPEQWLTPEELLTDEAGPSNFYVGAVDGEEACAFILQWSDREWWPEAEPFEAGYLHKLCVRRKFAHQGMTAQVVEAVNDVFSRLMSETVGGIPYDERAALYPGPPAAGHRGGGGRGAGHLPGRRV